jgi:tetratricopeptide (TPR) repeat protein
VIKYLLALMVAGSSLPLCADEFQVADVINPVLTDLGEPAIDPDFGKDQLAISSSSSEASAQVAQGIARLNASWDFEAYRHFCAAAKKDPDCMMAYWGIAMSLAGSEHEFYDQREAAVDRMLDLLEAGQGVEIERGYVEAAGRLLTGGVKDAGLTFQAISKKFPADIQSKLFALFLLRDGFDSFGDARPGQVKARKGLQELVETHPENLSVLSFWVSSQAEAPLDSDLLRDEVLPYARKLVRLKPDYPPFLLMLAHVEARCGNASLGIEACHAAIRLYGDYMKGEEITVFDCEGWVRAKVYLASLLATKGLYAESTVVSKELAAIKVPAERVFSPGAGMLLWEGRTIGARLAMGRTTKSEFEDGLKMLDGMPEEEWYKEKSFVLGYRDSLAFYLGIRKAILAGDVEAARVLYEQLLARARVFESKKALAGKTSTYSNWLRANNALGIAAAELRGMLAEMEEGAMKMAAVNWYQAAAERQSRPTNLLPPSVDYPMELRLGNYYLSTGDAKAAAKAFREGLLIRPNHLQTLEGFREALLKQGRSEDAELMMKRIEAVKA